MRPLVIGARWVVAAVLLFAAVLNATSSSLNLSVSMRVWASSSFIIFSWVMSRSLTTTSEIRPS